MNNVLVAIGVLIVAVVAAAFAVPQMIDWDRYRGLVEEEASRVLGRDVRIGGNLTLTLLPAPSFSLDRIRVADSRSGTGEPAFRAEQLKVRLSVAPLLKGVLEANDIEIRRARIKIPLGGLGQAPRAGGVGGGGGFSLPITIEDVALQNVRLLESEIVFERADGRALAALSGLDGEFASPALEGPYRFRGVFGPANHRSELRVVTQKLEADGSLRFKANLKSLAGGASTTVDGRILDARTAPRVEGELSGQLPLLKEIGSREVRGADQPSPAEFKSALLVDQNGGALPSLSIIFEQSGRPQILTGEARAVWSKDVDVSAVLAARWLDLDHVVGLPKGQSPLPGIAAFASRLGGLDRPGGRTELTLSVDQASLGGESVSGVVVRLAGAGSAIEVQEMRMGLPGGSRVEVTGVIADSGPQTTFNGAMAVQGSSLSRFASWAGGGGSAPLAGQDGPFEFRTRLELKPFEVRAYELTSSVLGTALGGEVAYRWNEQHSLLLSLEGEDIDLRNALPGGFQAGGIGPLLASAGSLPADMELAIRVRGETLRLPDRALRHVAAEATMAGGKLTLRRLRLALEEGASIDVEGDLRKVGEKVKGALRGGLAVRSVAGLDALAVVAGLDLPALLPQVRRGDLLPLDLAGSIRLHRPGAAPLSLDFDGTAAGQNVTVSLRSGSVGDGWATGPIELSIDVSGDDDASILRLAGLPAPARSAAAATVSRPAFAKIRASGSPSEAMMAFVSWDSATSRATFHGRIGNVASALTAEGAVALAGRAESPLFALFEPVLWPVVPEAVVTGSGQLSLGQGQWRLDRFSLVRDGVEATGTISIAGAGAERRLAGRVDLAEAPLKLVLAPVLARNRDVTAGAISVLAGRAGPWPDEPFDFSTLEGLSGDLAVTARRITLAEGMTLDQASFSLSFDNGLIEVRDLVGRGLGGTWGGAMRIERSSGGAVVQGMLRARDVRLSTQDTAGAADRGTLTGTLTFSGRGISPRGVVSSATGSGNVQVARARLAQVSPRQVAQAVESALRGPADALAVTLRQALQGAPAGVSIDRRDIGLDLSEGLLRTRPFSVDSADGRVEGQARMDLASFQTDVEWRIEAKSMPIPSSVSVPAGIPRPEATAKAPERLPPVTISLSGQAGKLGEAVPAVAVEALERELVVRKMERDLEELERLRRLDEQRAKEEAERRRLIEQAQPPLPGTGAIQVDPAAAGVAGAGQPGSGDASLAPAPVPDTVEPPAGQRAPRRPQGAPANAPSGGAGQPLLGDRG
jgi:hypothetical protein